MIVLKVASFVDVITNSSSELFVCDTTKSLETVQQVLEGLLDIYNKANNTEYKFENCFKPIRISEWGFDYTQVRQSLREEYESINGITSPPFSKYRTGYSFYEGPEALISQEKALRQAGHDYNSDAIKSLWTPHTIAEQRVYTELFIEFLKQNSLEHLVEDFTETAHKAITELEAKNPGKYGRIYFPDTAPWFAAWEFFDQIASWDMDIQKGNIIIESIGDNTIPYEMIEAINSFLDGHNYHLG